MEKVVDHVITQQKAQYQEEMIPEETTETHSEVTDDLYDEAVALIVGMQTASVSMLQRRFRIGYTRAARLIDAMEERGLSGRMKAANLGKSYYQKRNMMSSLLNEGSSASFSYL